MIEWSYYPRTDPLPEFLQETIKVFNTNHLKIDSTKNDSNELRLKSDQVLKVLETDLSKIVYEVEKGKKKIKR